MKSPYANAIIEDINTAIAEKVPGVEKIITYKDVNQKRFTLAGQSYPEASPCDRLVLDKHLRYVGDPVAIVAAENEKAAIKAIKLIKVKYNVLEPLLDPRKAKTMKYLFILKIAGMLNVQLGQIIREILLQQAVMKTVMLMKYSKNVML